MGSACCVAAKDRTITSGTPGEIIQRNVRYSPSWSFRWENRGRVAGEEISVNWFSDAGNGTDRLDHKSATTVETAYASEEGSPIDSFRTLPWQKSPASEGNTASLRLPPSESSIARSSAEVKESTASPAVSYPSPAKLSPSVPSVSSLSASPLSSQSHQPPANSTPSRWPRYSPGHQLLRQVSDSTIAGIKSPTFSISEEASLVLPGWSNDSTRGSRGGSSDGWSLPTFPDLVAGSRRERWSFDSESFSCTRDIPTRSSGRNSSSASFDLRTCGICAKLLTERSLWGGQKFVANSVAVVAVLICGHVYHAECLESMTPEINKYDPACPICTFGEKKALKMCEKALRAEMDSRAKKKHRNRVVDSNFSGNLVLDRQKSSGNDGRSPKMSYSSSMKSSLGRPFLKRHFSFGSKASKPLAESLSTRKRAYFWTRSSKE